MSTPSPTWPTRGWWCGDKLDQPTPAMHVVPAGDLIDRDLTGPDACVCGTRLELVVNEDVGDVWVATHASLDGRELSEPDYEGKEV